MAEITKETISFEEFLKRYDGIHAEWVAGEVTQVSNNVLHQLILAFLTKLLGWYLDHRPIGKMLIAGIPMWIADDQPAREPDLMIVLNEHAHRIKTTYVDGAADLAIEIVSPESVDRDRGTKFREYETIGVQEYWLIDPEHEEAFIYALSEGQKYRLIPLNTKGQLTSHLLPDFVLQASVLWQTEPPTGQQFLALLKEMSILE